LPGWPGARHLRRLRVPREGPARGVFDSANLVGPGGVIATYRKRNLVETTLEYRVFAAGADLPVVEAGGLRVALAVCWDLGFPEVAREAAAGGAELLLAPAAWREPWGAQYALSCAARALDSGIHLASANQLGDYPEARFGAPGHVYGPDGARISGRIGAASVARLDPDAPELWRGSTGTPSSAAAGSSASTKGRSGSSPEGDSPQSRPSRGSCPASRAR
jgi:predicted amidohydrolase